jgi:hypothetical protein
MTPGVVFLTIVGSALLVAVLLRLWEKPRPLLGLPFVRREALLTPAELRFYRVQPFLYHVS